MKSNFVNVIEAKKRSIDALEHFKSRNSSYLFTLSYTETATIPGLTIAGANTELTKFTPTADAEYIYFGRCKCIDSIPATPDGKPTPAIITKTALDLSNIPVMIIDSGVPIKPALPYITINSKFGKNITLEKSLEFENVMSNYEMGRLIGKEASKINDLLIIGESIPAGTTTALGVLLSLGIDAENKVSSSMPDNPHELKNKIVKKAFLRSNIKSGDLYNDPFKAISYLGDPMMPTVVGMIKEILSCNRKAILAGGTQMCCILALLKSLDIKFNNNLCIGTTSYVLEDKKSDFLHLINQISDDVPVIYTNLGLSKSRKNGLKAYSEGFVKEGAGAGGTTIAAHLKENYIDQDIFLSKLEENYYSTIEEPIILKNKADRSKENI
jgi:uncharacterized protein (TIGR00303 family)